METKNRDDEFIEDGGEGLTESQQLELQYNKKNLEHLNSMKKNKEVVKDVCDDLKKLIELEKGLREASEYRSSLQDNYTKLSGYLKNMEDIVDTYSRGFAAGQKFDKSVVKNNVNNFEKYAKKAKEIGINLNNIEKDIKQLLEIQSARDEVEKLRTDNANLQRQLEDNNKQPEKSEDLPSGATENIKSQGQKTSDKKTRNKMQNKKNSEQKEDISTYPFISMYEGYRNRANRILIKISKYKLAKEQEKENLKNELKDNIPFFIHEISMFLDLLYDHRVSEENRENFKRYLKVSSEQNLKDFIYNDLNMRDIENFDEYLKNLETEN